MTAADALYLALATLPMDVGLLTRKELADHLARQLQALSPGHAIVIDTDGTIGHLTATTDEQDLAFHEAQEDFGGDADLAADVANIVHASLVAL